MLVAWWVKGSIHPGGSIQQCFAPPSVPQLEKQKLWYVLSCLERYVSLERWDSRFLLSLSKQFQNIGPMSYNHKMC